MTHNLPARSATLGLLAAILAALLLPAAWNGGGFVFSDSPAYVRGADAVVFKLTGHTTEWSDRLKTRLSPGAAPPPPGRRPDGGPVDRVAPADPPNALAGRSVFYGVLPFVSFLTGTLWPLVFAQALLTALAVLLTIRRFEDEVLPARRALLVAVLAVTPAGFFAAFAMPDFLAPLAILSFAHLVIGPRRPGSGLRWFWCGLLAFAMLAHSATTLLVMALVAVTAALKLVRVAPARPARLALPLVAIAAALAGEFLFGTAVRLATGHAPVRPPFVMARLIADGPGKRFIDARCGEEPRFEVCRYRALPMTYSDTFLWSRDPAKGVFTVASPAEQRALAAEQSRFILAVIAYDPVGVARVLIGNGLEQFVAVRMRDFNYRPSILAYMEGAVPERPMRHVRTTAAARERVPDTTLATVALVVQLATLALLLVLMTRAARRTTATSGRDEALLFCLVIVLGVAINAMVCGALSGPHGRYQARIVFILPLALLATSARLAQGAGKER